MRHWSCRSRSYSKNFKSICNVKINAQSNVLSSKLRIVSLQKVNAIHDDVELQGYAKDFHEMCEIFLWNSLAFIPFVEVFSWAVKNAFTLHKYRVEVFS